MKNIIKATLSLALFACGGQASEDNTPYDAGADSTKTIVHDPEASDEDVEKAFSSPAGYGAEDNTDNACIVPWNNSLCWVPKTKNIKIRSLCTGCDTDQTNGWVTALYDFEAYFESKGWTVTFVGDNSWNVDMVTGDLPGTQLGETAITASVLDDVSGPGGTFRRFYKAEIKIDFPRLLQQIDSGYYGTCGTTCRRNIYRNEVLHELGHAGGFGHHSITPSLMKNDWPHSQAALAYQPFELVYIQNFSAN